jgi:cation:H+ antiporter
VTNGRLQVTMPADLSPWQQRVAGAVACTVPGVLTRLGGHAVPAPLQLAAYGAAVVAAAFMLAWACEAAQADVAQGLVVAAVAFVAILPEYVVEVHFAFTGRADYVSANLTGASRLLLGFCIAMPAVVALLPERWRPRRIGRLELAPQHRVELAFLAVAALWTLRATVRGKLGALDAVVLLALYVWYLRRTAAASDEESPALVGVSAELAALPVGRRRRWVGGLMGYAALVILSTAVPFGDAVLGTGALVGISPYLLLQWVVPVATEAPELVVAFVLLTHRRSGQAIALLLAGAVSQYTLALGTLPFAFLLGAGTGPLPLAPRERIELFLTVGVALYAVAALVTLRVSRGDTSIMMVLFTAQLLVPTLFTRLALALVFVVLAVDILVAERRHVRPLTRAFTGTERRSAPSAGRASERRLS